MADSPKPAIRLIAPAAVNLTYKEPTMQTRYAGLLAVAALLTLTQPAPLHAEAPPAPTPAAAPAATPAPSDGAIQREQGAPNPQDAAGDPAKDGAGKDAQGDQNQPNGGGGGLFGGSNGLMLGGLVLMIVVMMIFSGRSRKKQEAKRREMLASLKKGDKIITIGGIVGTAIEVREDEVTVKVDDTARMKFARWAIRSVGDDVKTDKRGDTDEKK